MANRRWLKQEVSQWVSDDVISEEAGKKILSRYKKEDLSSYKEAFFILAVVCLVGGLFFLCASLWNGLTQDQRFLMAFMPLVLSFLLVAAVVLLDKKVPVPVKEPSKLEEELDTRIFDRSQQPVCPTPVGIHIIEQAQNILVQANRIKNIIEEEKHSLTGTFKLGILPTVAPYLLPRFFPQLMKKYPDLDIRVVEMKTNDIKKALQTGEIDAGIVASLAGMEELQQTPLFYEQFFAYVSREDALFNNEVIRTSDLNGEQLWLLDEGHCFRDQLVRFCQMKSARASQLAYHLGSMETFMRMVESGKGVTFIPELAVLQLGDAQKELVRSFAIPCPTRQVVLLTNKNFIRHTLLEVLVKEIKLSVPKEMLSLKATQAVV